LQKAITDIVANGYPASQLFSQLFDKIVVSPDFTDLQKSRISDQIAIADKCLNDGADEFLQLMSVFSFIMRDN
jgi:replication factor C subunit 2/4